MSKEIYESEDVDSCVFRPSLFLYGRQRPRVVVELP